MSAGRGSQRCARFHWPHRLPRHLLVQQTLCQLLSLLLLVLALALLPLCFFLPLHLPQPLLLESTFLHEDPLLIWRDSLALPEVLHDESAGLLFLLHRALQRQDLVTKGLWRVAVTGDMDAGARGLLAGAH